MPQSGHYQQGMSFRDVFTLPSDVGREAVSFLQGFEALIPRKLLEKIPGLEIKNRFQTKDM